jgi:transcriptional regulator with XRE-family HTH domain
MVIGERLRELRAKKTLAEFAENLNVSGSQISAIETGKSNMSFDLAERICDQYNCTMDWLVRGIGVRDGSQSKVEQPPSEYIRELERKLMKTQEELLEYKTRENESLKNNQSVSTAQ